MIQDVISRLGFIGHVLLPFWFLWLVVDGFFNLRISLDILALILVLGVIFGDEMDNTPKRVVSRIVNWTRAVLMVGICVAWIPIAIKASDLIGEDDSFIFQMAIPFTLSFFSMLWLLYVNAFGLNGWIVNYQRGRYYKLMQRKVREEYNPFFGNEHDHKVFLCGSLGPNLELPERIARPAITDGVKIWSVAPPGGHSHILMFIDDCQAKQPRHAGSQGFVTTYGRFVDRSEGLEIARNASQIVTKHPREDQLYTEDMWTVSYMLK